MFFARTAALGLSRFYSTAPKVSFTQSMKNRYNWHVHEHPQMLRAATHLYEASVDGVDISAWFKHFQMPDTYLSWFFVTELHLWMELTRVMADTQEKRKIFLRKQLVLNLWKDCDERMKKIASMPNSTKRECMQDLGDHFNAAIIIYDEGFGKDDQALANAVWRVMLMCNQDLKDFRLLRTLVHYLRHNVAYLEDLSFEKFTEEDFIRWRPLQDSIKATASSV